MRFLFSALLAIHLPLCAADYPKQEIRAVWISTIYGMDWPTKAATNEPARRAQKQELCDQLDMLKAANFNTVFLQARLRGDVIYPSSIEPVNRAFTGKEGGNPGYDPLAFAIQECHKRGLECHAWFVTFPVGTADHVRRGGNKSVVKLHPSLCKLYNGEWYMDPGLPGTSNYIFSLVKEIVGGYDIDGIHFDYIRYPDHADGFPDAEVYARYGKSKTLREWRQDNITRMVERIYNWVKSNKPWVQVSSAPLGKSSPINIVPNAGQTGASVYQDAQKWLQKEKHDFLVPMLYFKDMFFYPFVKNWMLNKNERHIVVGLGVYRMLPSEDWPLEEFTRQIEYARASGAEGVAFFRGTQVFMNYKGLYASLKNNYFKYPALLPPLAWLSDEKPRTPLNLQATREGGIIRLSWRMPQGNNDGLAYTLYGSASGAVDTNNPAHILATGLRGQEAFFTAGATEEQGYTFRVTASNRYHIESAPSKDIFFYLSPYTK